jgi:beta-lactamase superfamily II metal-dependent hydrolase
MKMKVFHAADGDCLLLSSEDGTKNMLIDGGRRGSFTANTRSHLKKLRDDQRKLDVVCVTHIDNDHISGILQLIEDEVEWRKFEFAQANDPNTKSPTIPRPPVIGQIWHNALFQLVGEDLTPKIESTLITSASLLAGSEDRQVVELASRYDNLATGEKSAMELSRRISAEQLAIPLNTPANGKMMMRGKSGETIQLGNINLFVLGPSEDDLEALRTTWKTWIDKNEKQIQELHRRMLADEEQLGTLSPNLVANPIAASLGEGLSGITEPNLASLMLLAEEGNQNILLTGDGESGEILEGLKHHGKLDANGNIHVNVLKVQHHGALANVTKEFVEHVSADHYIFCGNGAHQNPELEVIEALARARLELMNTEFKFWFTSNSKTSGLSDDRKDHMQAVEKKVKKLVSDSGGRMKADFISRGHFEVL